MYTDIMIWSMEALAVLLIGCYAYVIFFIRPAATNQQMSVRPMETNQYISIVIHLLYLVLLLAAVGQIILLWYPAVPDRFRIFLAYTILSIATMSQCLAQLVAKQIWRWQKPLSFTLLVLSILTFAGLVVITILNL